MVDRLTNTGNCYAEIWENQVYWPITGWEAQKNCQYSDLYYEHGQEKFPVLELPNGWVWDGEWDVDHSKRYGETDAQGYCYGSSNERVLEKMIGCCSSDTPTTSSIIRRRCYVRTKVCTSDVANETWRKQLIGCSNTKRRLEENAEEKAAEWRYIVEFGSRRGQIFDIVFQRCADGGAAHVEAVTGIQAKLLLLRTFLTERSNAEREHARRLEQVSSKFIKADVSVSSSASASADGTKGTIGCVVDGHRCRILDDLDAWEAGHGHAGQRLYANMGIKEQPHSPLSPTTNACIGSNPAVTNALSANFFNCLSTATAAISERAQHFSILVAEGMLQDVTNLINLIANVLKSYETDRRQRTDAYRASEQALSRAVRHVQSCFETQQQLLVSRLAKSNFAYKVAAEQGGAHLFWKAGARRTLSKSASTNSFYDLSTAGAGSAACGASGSSLCGFGGAGTGASTGAGNEDLSTVDGLSSFSSMTRSHRGNTATTPDLDPASHNQLEIDSSLPIFQSFPAPASPIKQAEEAAVLATAAAPVTPELATSVNVTPQRFSLAGLKSSFSELVGGNNTNGASSSSSSSSAAGVVGSGGGGVRGECTPSKSQRSSSGNVGKSSGIVRGSRRDSFMHFGDDATAVGGTGIRAGGQGSSNAYEDMWLAVQMFRNCVITHCESLLDIMELQNGNVLLMQSLMSKANHVFIASVKLLTFEQCRIWAEAGETLEDTCFSVIGGGGGGGGAGLQSLSISPHLSLPSGGGGGGGGTAKEGGVSGDESESDGGGGEGPSASAGRSTYPAPAPAAAILPVPRRPLSSKSADFWLQDALGLSHLPNSAAVVMHGILAVASYESLAQCCDLAEVEELWAYRHVTVTVDGYIYICSMGRGGTPVLPPLHSYDASRCEFAHGVSGHGPIPHSIELRHTGSSSVDAAAACVIRTNDAEEALGWVTVMENPLSTNRNAPVLGGSDIPPRSFTSAASGVPTPPPKPLPQPQPLPLSALTSPECKGHGPGHGYTDLGGTEEQLQGQGVLDDVDERRSQEAMLAAETGGCDSDFAASTSASTSTSATVALPNVPERESIDDREIRPEPETLSFSYRMAASSRPSASRSGPSPPHRDITPTRNGNIRMSTRRSSKIEQYEKGLQESFTQSDSRVRETRQCTLNAFQIDPGDEKAASRVSQYERGLQESQSQYNARVKSSRQQTLDTFHISADGTSCDTVGVRDSKREGGDMSTTDNGSTLQHDEGSASLEAEGDMKAVRRQSTVKALASTFDK